MKPLPAIIDITCPACGTVVQVRRQDSEKRGRCACGRVFEIGAAIAEKEVVAQPSGRPKVAVGKYCSTCGTGLHKDAELCPACGVRQSPGSRANAGCLLILFVVALIGWSFMALMGWLHFVHQQQIGEIRNYGPAVSLMTGLSVWAIPGIPLCVAVWWARRAGR